jgi:transcriptional regulator with XRE-family HTH domain
MGHTHPLRTFRENQKLSRQGLADLLGVEKSTVWRWEAGERKINENLLPRVVERTGIAPADLRPDLAGLLKTEDAQ